MCAYLVTHSKELTGINEEGESLHGCGHTDSPHQETQFLSKHLQEEEEDVMVVVVVEEEEKEEGEEEEERRRKRGGGG